MPKKLDPKVAEKFMLHAGLKPLEPYKNAMSKWKCKCLKCEKIVYPTYAHIQSRGGGCGWCSGLFPDLEKIMILMEKAGLKPLEPYRNSNTKWKCKCLKCKKIVYPRYGSIQQGYGGCVYCGGQKVDVQDAVEVMKKAGLLPLEPYKSALSKWKCQCLQCKNIVYPKYNAISQGQGGCIDCGYKKVASSLRLDEQTAVSVMLKAKLQPLEPYTNSNTKWKSKCLKCEKIIYPRLNDIQQGHSGCGWCSGLFPDLEKIMKIIKKADLEPLEPYKSAMSKWKCKCLKCEKIVYPVYAYIQQGDGGCANCASHQIKLDNPSYIYLITHPQLNAHKVGIANFRERKTKDRLHRLIHHGWQPFRKWELATGSEAIEIEKKVFKVIRKERGIPVFLSKSDMRVTRGETETMDADLISLKELEKIINKVIRELQIKPTTLKKN